eukprot:6172503-Pleurochrysis_carterae.AAC.1
MRTARTFYAMCLPKFRQCLISQPPVRMHFLLGCCPFLPIRVSATRALTYLELNDGLPRAGVFHLWKAHARPDGYPFSPQPEPLTEDASEAEAAITRVTVQSPETAPKEVAVVENGVEDVAGDEEREVRPQAHAQA